MSDFINNFWSVYVAGITLISIFACLVLLIVTARAKVSTSSDNTTGHVWDEDLRELNNPMPRWWVWLFVITIVFGVAYLLAYPGLGSYAGKLQWTQEESHAVEVQKANEQLQPLYAKFTTMTVEDVANDPEAMGIGQRLFLNNCAQCHGSDARGNKGFPNLTDSDWLYGGAPENIKETIINGRFGLMPPQAEAVGTADDVRNVANYVLSLSDSPHDPLRASQGQAKFVICAACHGADAKGNTLIGAPNLTDKIWLHGAGEQAIIDIVNNGKMNEMPAQASKLTPAQIDVLTAYVWGLSNKTANSN